MAANTKYKLALEIAQLLCGFSKDTDRWYEFTEKIKQAIPAKAIQLTIVSTRSKEILLDIENGYCDETLLNWVSMNETAVKDAVFLKETNKEYKTIQLEFALTDREWGQSYPVARDAHGPSDISHAFVCASRFLGEGVTVLLGIMRDEEQGAFSEEELELLKLLRNSFHKAFYDFARHYVEQLAIASMQGMINRAALGLFVVDASGYALVQNSKAENILGGEDIFSISESGCLHVSDRIVQDKLRKCIQDITADDTPVSREPEIDETYIRVSSETNAKGYLMIVSPVASANYSFARGKDGKLALIQIINLTDSWTVDAQALRNVLDITGTEAKVLKYLSEGMSLREIAKTKGRSYHTIRNHIQKVMNKTGMHRQADLMLLVHSIALAGAAREEEEDMRRESS